MFLISMTKAKLLMALLAKVAYCVASGVANAPYFIGRIIKSSANFFPHPKKIND